MSDRLLQSQDSIDDEGEGFPTPVPQRKRSRVIQNLRDDVPTLVVSALAVIAIILFSVGFGLFHSTNGIEFGSVRLFLFLFFSFFICEMSNYCLIWLIFFFLLFLFHHDLKVRRLCGLPHRGLRGHRAGLGELGERGAHLDVHVGLFPCDPLRLWPCLRCLHGLPGPRWRRHRGRWAGLLWCCALPRGGGLGLLRQLPLYHHWHYPCKQDPTREDLPDPRPGADPTPAAAGVLPAATWPVCAATWFVSILSFFPFLPSRHSLTFPHVLVFN